MRYRLDGDQLLVRDDSLGELPNFVRQVRTLASWEGQALKTETETVSESIDERTGAPRTGHGITSVLTFRLAGTTTNCSSSAPVIAWSRRRCFMASHMIAARTWPITSITFDT